MKKEPVLIEYNPTGPRPRLLPPRRGQSELLGLRCLNLCSLSSRTPFQKSNIEFPPRTLGSYGILRHLVDWGFCDRYAIDHFLSRYLSFINSEFQGYSVGKPRQFSKAAHKFSGVVTVRHCTSQVDRQILENPRLLVNLSYRGCSYG